MRYEHSSLRDYKSGWSDSGAYKRRGNGIRWAVLGTLSGLAVGLFSLTSFDANALRVKELPLFIPATNTSEIVAAETGITAEASIPLPHESPQPASTEVTAELPGNWHTVTVKQGDSLAKIFNQQGIPPRQLHDILATGGVAKKLTRIYPGQTLRLRTSTEDGLLELLYDIDALNQVQVSRTETGYEPQLIVRVPDRQIQRAAANIDSSLFLAAQKANLPETITMELAGIFG